MARAVLAIETSCDDTSVAVVESTGFVRVCFSADQNPVHEPFGGVVPEIASRNHTLHLLPLVEKALVEAKLDWSGIDGIAVTSRPGLIGSLLVGVITAKTLAQALGKPLIGVNHLEGHIVAPFLRDEKHEPPVDFGYPFVSLAVSGGHTSLYFVAGQGQYEILGATRDDAAGEAYDKFGQLIGLGFPGGVRVDREAAGGDPAKYAFPRTMLGESSLEFSFSGLKSSAARLVHDLGPEKVAAERAHLCAGFQEAVVDVLMAKLALAVTKMRAKHKLAGVSITGGVSANSRLRARATEWAAKSGLTLAIPPLRFCTDNAAMIGLAGLRRLEAGQSDTMALAPKASSFPEDFITGISE